MKEEQIRIERDSMGELAVPSWALWGAQTQRAVNNFPISGMRMPRPFICALGLIKATAAQINGDLGLMDLRLVEPIVTSALEVAEGKYDEHFPIDVFQTGSGTSSNMNANEVIANLASRRLQDSVHPNDHVNLGQSSNDVIPTAIHVSAAMLVRDQLLPALAHLHSTLEDKANDLDDVIKTGRTHLMDAMPVRLSQELGAWASQIEHSTSRINRALEEILYLAQGGTAVGTGINAHPEFAALFCARLSEHTTLSFKPAPDYFESLSSQDGTLQLSAQLRGLAVVLTKIGNDLRWMNSGPLAGIGEISLPSLQPGSSIMPGKVNPVIPEATVQVAAQIVGNDTTIAWAVASGNFQLNVMLPVIAANLLQSIELLSNMMTVLADKAIAGFNVNVERIQSALERNPILVTALNHVIGYDEGARIAKQAYAEGRAIIDVAKEQTNLTENELRALLDPRRLTEGGTDG